MTMLHHRKVIIFLAFLLLMTATSAAQTKARVLGGRVTDQNGELLAGVGIQEIGTTNGTFTDENGTYNLTLLGGRASLRFSFVGFLDKVIEAGSDQKVLDVTLEPDVDFLDEVVVVGFGTQKKASVVGAISAVEPVLLASAPVRSISNNLAGKLSGVIAVQRSGNPYHNNSEFWIRGISTFAGNAAPLVLIDGIERSLDDIDPHEVESFSVLKDAAASAVYGVRGANGVIMITTKRGKIGRPKVTFRTEQAVTSPTMIPEYVDAVKYIEILNEASYNSNPEAAVPFDKASVENYRSGIDPELYPNVNWWKLIANDYASNNTSGLDINGGSDVLRYALTLGTYDETGIMKHDPMKNYDSSLRVRRYTVRSNIDVNLTRTTLFRLNLGGFLQNFRSNPGDTDEYVFKMAVETPPHLHPYIYSDGRIPKLDGKVNPWAYVTQRGYQTTSAFRLESLASLEQGLDFVTEGLKARLTFSFDRFASSGVVNSKDPDYYLPATGRDANGVLIAQILSNGQEFLGTRKETNWGNMSTYLESNLFYNRLFGGKHDVGAMLLYNQGEKDFGDRIPYRQQGFAGRFSYTYDNRYVAEINFGYNGSENFAKGYRFGFFPSVSAGWIVSQERFMDNIRDVLSNLKIRASWGKAGNSNIGGLRFAYISTIGDMEGYRWGADPYVQRAGKAEDNIGVSNLTWETSTKSNIGVDVGLFKNAVNFTADYFTDFRENIFMKRKTIPGSAGFMQNPFANFGKVFNHGFEASLKINKSFSDGMYLIAFANFTWARNRIVEYDESESVKNSTRAHTGHPVGQIFGLIDQGLFTAEDFDADGNLKLGIPAHTFAPVKPGDIRYKDLNGDNQIDALDATAIGGTFNPEIVYGLGATFGFKGFDMGFFFQGVGKTTQVLGGAFWIPGQSGGSQGNILSNVDDRWTEANPRQNVFWPRLSYTENKNNTPTSTWWLKDKSFVRLKSAEIGWALPHAWVSRIGCENVRLFLRGSNLLTFSNFKLWDPELRANNGQQYPITKLASVGITVDFK